MLYHIFSFSLIPELDAGKLQMPDATSQSIGLFQQAVFFHSIKRAGKNGVLKKEIINNKPLHIEYTLIFKGKMLVPVFQQLESML